MPLPVAAIIVATIVVTVLATILIGRWRRRNEQADDCDADSRGFIGAILSGLFIVALAFYVVIVWEEAGTAEDNAATEAAALADAYWQMGVAPEPQRERIRGLIREYTTSVVDEEWPALSEGTGDERTGDLLITLHSEINQLPTTPDQVKSARDRSLERMRDVTDKRRDRIGQAGGLSPTGHLMLIATIAGAVGMVAFPLLVGFTARVRHVVLIGVMAAALALTCVLLLDITQPFAGRLMVEPEVYRMVSEEFLRIP